MNTALAPSVSTVNLEQPDRDPAFSCPYGQPPLPCYRLVGEVILLLWLSHKGFHIGEHPEQAAKQASGWTTSGTDAAELHRWPASEPHLAAAIPTRSAGSATHMCAAHIALSVDLISKFRSECVESFVVESTGETCADSWSGGCDDTFVSSPRVAEYRRFALDVKTRWPPKGVGAPNLPIHNYVWYNASARTDRGTPRHYVLGIGTEETKRLEVTI